MGSIKKGLRINEDIMDLIGDVPEGEWSERVQMMLDRYGLLCRRERVNIEKLFAENERKALTDACWSTAFFGAASILGAVQADFEDSGPDGLYEKWDVDAPAVVKKLKALNVGQQIALVEYIERMRDEMANPKKAKK